MQSLHSKPNLLFLIAVRSYKLAGKTVRLTPKLRGPIHTKRLEDVWKVSWREIEKKYKTAAVCSDQDIAKIETRYRIVLPDDLKRYLKTVSNDIWGEPFSIGMEFLDLGVDLCEIPPNTSVFKGYECPYVAQGNKCQICSAPFNADDDVWYMPVCNNDTFRGMVPIGPGYSGTSDWIVINAANPVNYGTVWTANPQGELMYIADSFGDYVMSVLRGRITRERIVPTYIPIEWGNDYGAVDHLQLNWNLDIYNDFLGPVQNDNNAANDINNSAPSA